MSCAWEDSDSVAYSVGHVVNSVLGYVVLFPFSVWTLMKLHQHRHEQFLIKRRLFLVRILIVMVVMNGITGTTYGNLNLFYYCNDSSELGSEPKGMLLLQWAITIPLVVVTPTLYLMRVWLLYFDLQLSQLIKSREWRMVIDPTTESNNWYLNPFNQRMFGNNGEYLSLMALFISLIEMLIHYGMIFIDENSIEKGYGAIVGMLVSLSMGIKIAAMLWIALRFRKFTVYDNFGIYQEMKKTSITFGICLVPCAITIIVTFLTQNRKYYVLYDLEVLLWGISATYICGIYVVKFNCQNNKNKLESRAQSDKSISKWWQIIDNAIGYESFMTHLQSEFSIENLLFITEYVQIKQVLKYKYAKFNEIFNDKTDENYKSIKFFVQLPQIDNLFISRKDSNINEDDTTPISSIAKQLDADGNAVLAFKSLYFKYIDSNNAPFMINISFRTREMLSKLLDPRSNNNNNLKARSKLKGNDFTRLVSFADQDWNDRAEKSDDKIELLIQLVSKMDIAAKEISSLMNDSFSRFIVPV